MPRRRIAIVGYGTAGQALRLFLQRRIDAEIEHFEQAETLQPVGAGFLLQPTGLSVLAQLGLAESALRCGARIARLFGENDCGRPILEMRYGELAADCFGLGLQRGALFSLLRAADESPLVHTGIRMVDVDAQRGLLRDAAHREYGPYDLIVIADGAHSALRARMPDLLRADTPYPWGAIWCLVDGRGSRFADALLQRYRLAREMCGVLPVGRLPDEAADTFRLSLYWSVRCSDFDRVFAAGAPALQAQISALWPEVADLLGSTPDLSIWRRASYRDVLLKQLWQGRVVVIGDAAHGMSPQLGQGVNMALLDAEALSRALERHPDQNTALARFARERRAHFRLYQLLSRWMTPLFQSDHDALARLRDRWFLQLSQLPVARGEGLRVLTGIKRGWFGRWRPPND